MFDHADNIPTDWPSIGKRNGMLERLALARWRRLMVDFAKFIMVNALDRENLLEPDDMLDAWMDQTFHKPEVKDLPVERFGYKERPSSDSLELNETPFSELPTVPKF
jgi:hypothetical protein